MEDIRFSRGTEELKKKKKSKMGEINFKVETIIGTSTMINIVMLAQFEWVNWMTEWTED